MQTDCQKLPLISVIIPYWDRRELLARAVERYRLHYRRTPYELVIVNDGTADPMSEGNDILVVDLPFKNIALNPCTPINAGVRAARGDIIVLTGPEIEHTAPVLGRLYDELVDAGPTGYVTAAAWCPETQTWNCHSSINGRVRGAWPVPLDAGFHFCAMMHREFFGDGFDEAYREGQAFDDNDFLWSLYDRGAVFRQRDDLVVLHHRTATRWPAGGWERNRRIFDKKHGRRFVKNEATHG